MFSTSSLFLLSMRFCQFLGRSRPKLPHAPVRLRACMPVHMRKLQERSGALTYFKARPLAVTWLPVTRSRKFPSVERDSAPRPQGQAAFDKN